MDFISASPLLILLTLAVIAWFTDSRVLKLAALLFFFGYPLVQGKTTPPSPEVGSVLDLVVNTVSYWLGETLASFTEFLKEKLLGG